MFYYYNAEMKYYERPIVVKPWATASDAEIADIVQAYYDGTLSLADIQEVWSVGDVRTLSLSAMAATGVGESHRAQDVDLVILDFNHDDLTTSVGGKTKALVSVQLKNCLRDASVSDTGGSSNTENGYMNSTNTNVGGWNSCARRTWCNSVFYNALPSLIKNSVKQVIKVNNRGGGSTSAGTSTDDYVWLPSEYEVFAVITKSGRQEGTQYAYYGLASENTRKLPKWNSSTVSCAWWERSPLSGDTTYFCEVSSGGITYGYLASNGSGLAPAFCM